MKPHSVPFLDLSAAYLEIQAEIEPRMLASLRSGWFIGGPEVESFEESFSEYVEAAHCVSVANGLDALALALRAMGVAEGDEVIVPSNTFIATWLAVSHCGAIPVPVEPLGRTFNIDPKRIEAAITSRTKVIIPVHLYGQPADLGPILGIARERGIRVLEDAAQAHGARYCGRAVGAHGDAVAWSFYPGKNLGALGDGGAVTTNDAALAEEIRTLRNYGSRVKYVCEAEGFNSRLDPVQAAALSTKLTRLAEWNARRVAVANRYDDGLRLTGLRLPEVLEHVDCVWHLYVVRTGVRDALRDELGRQGVNTLIHYPIPPHLQKAYAAREFKKGSFPIAETMAEEMLSLPMGPHLSEAQQQCVIDAIVGFSREHDLAPVLS